MLSRSWLVAPPVAGAAAWGVPPVAGFVAAAPLAALPTAVGAAVGGALAQAATIGVATAARVAAPVQRSRARRPKDRGICGSSLQTSGAEYTEYEGERRAAASAQPSGVRPRRSNRRGVGVPRRHPLRNARHSTATRVETMRKTR